MREVQRGLALGAVTLLVALTALAAGVGLTVGQVAVSVGCGGVVLGLAWRGATAQQVPGWTRADQVTGVRAGLVCAVAGPLLAGPVLGGPALDPTSRAWAAALSAAVLVLDGVDGRVARVTGCESGFGARFDMETDAFLILLLSVAVADDLGAWVLLIGAARYLLLAATACWPWLREPTPTRWWAKAVAVVQGVTLTTVLSGLLPRALAVAVVLGSLALLAESFWWQVRWLRRHRGVGAAARAPAPVAVAVLDVLAVAVVWAALALPETARHLSVSGFVRLPVEVLVLAALALVVPMRLWRAWSVAAGVLLVAVVLVKALNLGFTAVLDRPFDPLSDSYYVGPGIGVLQVSLGTARTVLALAVAVVGTIAVCVVGVWALTRLGRLARRRRRAAAVVVASLTALWCGAAATGLELSPSVAVASHSSSELALAQVEHLRADLADRQVFAAEIADDPMAATPDRALLRGLRGKDVLVVFVESYGRVALEDEELGPAVRATLDDGTRRLAAAGYDSRSAFLTSPTFGAASWLAHSTLQSGLWVDSQQRYNQLLLDRRLTLTRAFARGGWRTVFTVPAVTSPWPQGADFYGFDQLYDAEDVGYQGPAFGYASMPDQYTLETFRRLELAPRDRDPVMAEIDLVSSHHPWTPLPALVPWQRVGDGSVFDGTDEGVSAEEAFRDADDVRRLYRDSIVYSWSSLISFLADHPDPDLVVLALGDHQPHSYVTGPDPGHDVPVTLITQDRDVLARTDSWGWSPGLRPPPDAVVWRMDEVRDRLLRSFG